MYIFFLVYLLLLALNIWIFLIAPKRPLSERIATVLQIVGVYTFCFGVVAKAGLLPTLGSIERNLTSPDLLSFALGNVKLTIFASSALSLALDPDKTAFAASFMVEGVFMLLLAPFVVVAFVAYVVFVLPWAYLAYVFVSIPVDAILTASRDICITVTDPAHGESTYCIKQAMQANTVAFKNFLVAAPAVAFAFALKVAQGARQTLAERLSGLEFAWARTPFARRAARYGLWGVQAFATFVLLVSAALGLGSLFVVAAQPGAVFGSVLALLLILWLEFLMVRKLGAWRRAL